MASSVLRLHLSRPPFHLLTSLSKLPFLSPTPSPPRHRRLLFCTASTFTPITHKSPLGPLNLNLESSDSESESDPQPKESAAAADSVVDAAPLPSYPSPKLSPKEKKELAAYAHGLGKKLKSQQVGKSGVTPSVAAAFVENLDSNELLKLKVHGSCPGELDDVIKQLEEATGSVAVAQIGRSVILYRPSLKKIEKKEPQVAKKAWKLKPKESPTTFKTERNWKVRRESGHRQHQIRHS